MFAQNRGRRSIIPIVTVSLSLMVAWARAADSTDKPNLSLAELKQLADDYARDWNLGPEAHPCDLKSSTDPAGRVRSSYVPSPMLMA